MDLELRSASYPGDGWRSTKPAGTPGHLVEDVDPAPARRSPRQRPRMRLGKRRLVLGAVVCTMLCSLIARPAAGDPVASIPDVGQRPVAAGQIQYPGENTGTGTNTNYVANPVLGPLANQVMAEDVAVQQLGEQLKQLEIDKTDADTRAGEFKTKWEAAVAEVDKARKRADSAAADAYKAAAGLGPLEGHAKDVHDFSVLAPGLGGQPGGQEAARALLRAQKEEQSANEAYQLAKKAAADLLEKYTSLNATFQQRRAALEKLKTDNAGEYAKALAASDAYEASLGGNLAEAINIDGMQANPKAVEAVNWALSKLGAPYVWGDEGPNTFDCSGLAYWSYGKVGVKVPRVAAYMYHGTHAIAATKNSRGDLLLPGDLVYFASNTSDWHTIYHMGIYIGGGRMVQAPTTGDVVKISPVTWSRFFGATRIFDAVPKPGATTAPPTTTPPVITTTPPKSTTTSPPKSTSPSTSTSPSKSTSPSTSTSPSKSTSPSTSTSPSKSPSPSTAPATAGSASSGSKAAAASSSS